MKTAFKSTLAGLVLSTALGAAACGGEAKSSSEASQPRVMTVVPTDRVERSTAARDSSGSYTFPFSENGEDRCAYRDGYVMPEYHHETNRTLEYESVRVNKAHARQKPVSFTTETMTPEGCYVIKDWTDLSGK
ncbi:TPA: hypothetical protein HA251_02800 [Candidatus Woesearchaeota archaeon]|nr:hypothetical protein [Candidatus Woesearchaeota archaeon]